MNILSDYMVILLASANYIFKVFEHKFVWIQIRSFLLLRDFTGPDFAGPDLGLNCMQN